TIIRLYGDRCEAILTDGKPKPSKLHEGRWGKEDAPVKPYAATGKPEDRDYWFKDTEQHWEKVGEGKWAEIAKDAKYDWIEKQNTKQFIELNDASRNLTIRLGDDACNWVKGGGKVERLYPGKWGKPETTTNQPDNSKPVARAKADWIEAPEKATIPEGVVAGKLAAQEFNPDRVEYNVTRRSLWFIQGKPNQKPDFQI